jgi:hypothetical protein
MGRPDTLGADLYHNRRFPVTEVSQSAEGRDIELLDHAHCAIIKCMVDLSRITKSICLRIYLPQPTLAAAITPVRELENQIEQWIAALPEAIRPIAPSAQDLGLQRARDLQWMKRQRLVLTMSRFPSCVASMLDHVADDMQDTTTSESYYSVLCC